MSLWKPLYDNAPISVKESVYATYLYVIKNKLSYQATSQLLDLLQIHIPSPNKYPQSFHALRKCIEGSPTLKVTHFCSNCFKEVPEQKSCSSPACRGFTPSHYALLPFEEQLQDIFTGILN